MEVVEVVEVEVVEVVGMFFSCSLMPLSFGLFVADLLVFGFLLEPVALEGLVGLELVKLFGLVGLVGLVEIGFVLILLEVFGSFRLGLIFV